MTTASNELKLQTVFSEALSLPAGTDVTNLEYRGIEQWDSVAHMQLIAEIEDGFDIMIDTQDVIDMNSYAKALEILGKYGVDLDA